MSNPIPISDEAALRPAVSYLRVSTREQAERGGQDEGFSIPAQRLANRNKAASLGATIVAEFVDAGESARKADRPQLQAMLDYVADNDVSYCIVHKVDRLARNRADDVQINIALGKAGTKLVSATENIDETPSGMLVHGIMSSIAEFYSRNLATEVTKGLTQKALSGGTVTRAPLGYKNIRHTDSLGRESRTVEVDEERAPLVRWAFEAYATGNWSLSMLHEELTRRGLRTRPTPRFPAKPLMRSNLHDILRNPYYIGQMVYRGVTYQGSHEQIIDKTLWQRVQDMLSAHNTAGDRQRSHEHYLKGSVYCGSCGSRLMITQTKNRYGVLYEYFVCIGRHQKRTDCIRQAMNVDAVERVVENAWSRLRLTYDERTRAEMLITEAITNLSKEQGKQRAHLERDRAALLLERTKLLAAHYADAIPLSLLKVEQHRIANALAVIEEELDGAQASHEVVLAHLDAILDLLQHAHSAYMEANPVLRRLLNQAFAEKIYIDEESTATLQPDVTVGVIHSTARPPLRLLEGSISAHPVEPSGAPPGAIADDSASGPRTSPQRNPLRSLSKGVSLSAQPSLFTGKGLNKAVLVDPRGFEPLTPCMPCRCATGLRHGPVQSPGRPDDNF
ncbi:MAG: Resolvase domain protein [Rhodoglobus sp.]|nr:Resolvase domain protein [Rhodoglobus sp.]